MMVVEGKRGSVQGGADPGGSVRQNRRLGACLNGRREKTPLDRLGFELSPDHVRFHDGELVFPVDLQNAVHPLQVEQDHALLLGEAVASLTGADGLVLHAVAVAGLHDALHLFDVCGQQNGLGLVQHLLAGP